MKKLATDTGTCLFLPRRRWWRESLVTLTLGHR